MRYDAKAYHEIYHGEDIITPASNVTGEIVKPKAKKETPVETETEETVITEIPEETETEENNNTPDEEPEE